PLRLLPPGRPVVDDVEKASTREAARLSLEDFDRPGLLADGRFTPPPPDADE
nr:hypothetical protein [Solirubrobacterales bacterium]